MPKYIDVEKIRLTAVGTVDEDGDILVSVRDVKRAIEQTPAADVVPKSEVERLEKELENMLVSKQTELHIPMEYVVRVRTEHPIYKAIKTEVAREIFEEIENVLSDCGLYGRFSLIKISELKKKYTGEQK